MHPTNAVVCLQMCFAWFRVLTVAGAGSSILARVDDGAHVANVLITND